MKACSVLLLICVLVVLVAHQVQEVNAKWVTFTEFLGRYVIHRNKTEMAEIVGVACNNKKKKRDESGVCRTVY